MDEVADIGPIVLIAGPWSDRRSEAFRLHAHPERADSLGGQFAVLALGVDLALEVVERDLPHHGVEHVLDLGGEHRLASGRVGGLRRSEEHTSELQSPYDLVCRLLLEKKKKKKTQYILIKKKKKKK